MGRFQKGEGGRPKGSKNRKPAPAMRPIVAAMLSGEMDKFKAEMEQLSGKDYCDIYLKLLAFVVPKATSITLDTDKDNPLKNITIEVIDRADQVERDLLPS